MFHDKLAAAGITQSMSRVGKRIDNGPMEGFWGILKRERYYDRKFTSWEQLSRMIREYIAYCNFSRLQSALCPRACRGGAAVMMFASIACSASPLDKYIEG